jgi:FkbM family methyltransferase
MILPRKFRNILANRLSNINPFAISDICVLGQRMKLFTHLKDDVLGAMLRGERSLCPHFQAELSWLKDEIQPGYFVIDAGGNMGSISVALSMKEPNATIITFEPDPLNYSLLQLNTIINGCTNIFPFNYAIGNTEELILFYNSPNNFGDHRSSKPKGLDLRESEFTPLPMPVSKVRASFFLKNRYPGQEFDLVKIDTQGADFEILDDIFSILKPNGKVAIEFSPYHLDTNGTSQQVIFDLLSSFSKIYKISPNPKGSYILEKTDCNNLRHFYNDQCTRYKLHYDLVLIR